MALQQSWVDYLVESENMHVHFWKTFKDWDLNRLIEMAYLQNFDLQIAKKQVETARFERLIKKSELYPQLDFQGAVSQSRVSPSDPFIPLLTAFNNKVNFFQFGFDAIWQLDFWGKIQDATRAKLYEMKALNYAKNMTQVIVFADLASAYLELRYTQQEKHILCHLIDVVKKITELQKLRFCAGFENELNFLEAQILTTTFEEKLYQVEKEERLLIYQIATLTSKNPNTLLWLLEPKSLPKNLHILPLSFPSTLLKKRPDILEKELLIQAALNNLSAAKKELFPSFSIPLSYGRESDLFPSLYSAKSTFWSYGINLLAPLFHGGKIKANIKANNQRYLQAVLEYKKTIQDATREVEDHLITFTKEKEKLFSVEKALLFQQKKFALYQDRFDTGLENGLNTFTAMQKTYETQIQKLQIEKAITQEVIALYKAFGGGWEVPPTQLAP